MANLKWLVQISRWDHEGYPEAAAGTLQWYLANEGITVSLEEARKMIEDYGPRFAG